MLKMVFALALGAVLSSTALANDEAYYEIKKVTHKDVTAQYEPFMNLLAQPGMSADCAASGKNLRIVFSNDLSGIVNSDLNPLKTVEVVVDQIINIGKKVWNIVDAGRPVVNMKLDTANALPQGVACWNDLSGWTMPKTKVYQVDYENAFGMNVVSFAYRVTFTANGSADGVGKYITNATFMPANLDVSWGYNFDAQASVPSVFNQGTSQAPLAGMQMNMAWKVTTPLKHSQSTESFYVSGDNTFQHLK